MKLNKWCSSYGSILQPEQLEESVCFSHFLYVLKILHCSELSCDRMTRCCLIREVSSSLIGGGGGRLFNTLLSVIVYCCTDK